jgi:hypothetical protein
MTATNQNRLNRRQVLALRGLRLPHAALKLLREAGIYCVPAVSIDWQKVPDTYVIRGRESGGAVAQMGAYCGFVRETGDAMEWLDRMEAVGRNGFHALVVAPQFARVQVFRNERSYDLLITRHRLVPRAGRRRPLLENTILFHGVRGTLPAQARCAGAPSRNDLLPAFDDGFGAAVTVPEKFEDAARRAIAGAHCVGCHHSHLLQPTHEKQEYA